MATANFITNVLLKDIIGSELINNDNIAVLELVKNSFDAASKRVEISFLNIKSNDDGRIEKYSPNTSKIIIQDWGVGMTKQDITEKWLNIAFSDKKEKKEEFGRLLAGNKGIGRFSCDRLGKYLDIYTKSKESDSFVHLQVDWTKFEIPNRKDLQIQSIPVEIKQISKENFKESTGFSPFSHGTILSISKLRGNWAILEEVKIKKEIFKIWNVSPLLSLRKYLERLINPNQALGEKNTFEIFLYTKEFSDKNGNKAQDEEDVRLNKPKVFISGKVENKIFESLNFKTTSIEATIAINDGKKELTTELKDKGRTIYKLVEDITNDKEYKHLNNLYTIIYYLNTYAKIYFAQQTSVRSVNFGSIHLFRNGFRVAPYGDEGDDWLGLELRKGQGQRRFLGTRDIVGRIEMEDLNNTFKEVTSREGLVQDQAFQELKNSLYMTAHKRLEKYVVDGLKWDSVPAEVLKDLNTRDNKKSFNDTMFQISDEEKRAYALEAIRSIIKGRGDNIVSFYVDSSLVLSLADEERGKFEEVYKDFEKFGANKIDKGITKALNEVKVLLSKKEQEIKLLKEKAIEVNSEEAFTKEKTANTKELIALQHHINQGTERINRQLFLIKEKLNHNGEYGNINVNLDIISFESRKISTLAKFVTRAKFNVVTTLSEQDLVAFISEYVSHIYSNYADKIINKQLVDVIILMKQKFKFPMIFRPLDVIIIIDNLLDNAFKAGAKHVQLHINKITEKVLELRFVDNGRGLDKTIKNINQIFEFGFTTYPNGTGIGLYHVKSTIEKMGGEISVKENAGKGLEFIIKLIK